MKSFKIFLFLNIQFLNGIFSNEYIKNTNDSDKNVKIFRLRRFNSAKKIIICLIVLKYSLKLFEKFENAQIDAI